ncbi:AzlC family ABC transporter permease [Brucellaceae bacterium C25G]
MLGFVNSDKLSNNQYWRGLLRGMPLMVANLPFGLLFGMIAVKNGFSAGDAVLMSATIYAGASQLVGIELFNQHVAPWMIVLAIFTVNFRHVLYSAAIGRRLMHFTCLEKVIAFFLLVDPQFAETERHAEAGNKISFGWYMGLATPVYIMWVTNAYIGATFGNLIDDPHALGLDFLLPLYFLGLVMSFRARPNWFFIVLGSAVCAVLGFIYVGSPWHVTLGTLGGIAVAVLLAKPVPEMK